MTSEEKARPRSRRDGGVKDLEGHRTRKEHPTLESLTGGNQEPTVASTAHSKVLGRNPAAVPRCLS